MVDIGLVPPWWNTYLLDSYLFKHTNIHSERTQAPNKNRILQKLLIESYRSTSDTSYHVRDRLRRPNTQMCEHLENIGKLVTFSPLILLFLVITILMMNDKIHETGNCLRSIGSSILIRHYPTTSPVRYFERKFSANLSGQL